MALEIERKFRVANIWPHSPTPKTIVQGYLNSHPERTVRVRIDGEQGFLTVKGIGNDSGVSRFEWEKEIPLEDAYDLLALCEGTIAKKRHCIEVGSHTFEVDVFEGLNEGLVIAEVELAYEFEEFIWPTWLIREVTGDVKYYNSHLMLRPYTTWPAIERLRDQSVDQASNMVTDREADAILAAHITELYEE